MNEIEIDDGFEVEVSPTFFGSSGGVGLVEEDEDDIEQLPQQDDESTMNDESSIAAASSYISRGYSYVASNTKWVIVVMAAAFVVFFSIGVGLGYGPIGNSIFGNDDASSVSSAMAVDFTASDHDDKSDGGAKSGKSKSDKSSGVSCVEYVHRFCAYDMNQPPFRCKTTTNQQSVYVVLMLPSNTDKSREGYSRSNSISFELTNSCSVIISVELTHWITNYGGKRTEERHAVSA